MSKDIHRHGASEDSLKQVKESEAVHHESTRKKTQVGGNIGQLNLTSMMDVTFLLLVFFILTATFALNEGVLKADLPKGPGKPSPSDMPSEPIKIVIKSLGMSDVSIQIEGVPTPMAGFEELYQYLNQNRYDATQPNGIYKNDDPVIISPGSAVPWDAVVEAFNAANRAKYKNVNFAEARGE